MEGGNSSDSNNMNRRLNNKRTHDTMTESHRSTSPPSFFFPRHESPLNDLRLSEHPSTRARLTLPPLDPRTRFHGDGFDFRRPAMAPVTAERLGAVHNNQHVDTIDLTREAPTEHRVDSAPSQRLPRYGREIIDLASSEDEREAQTPSGTMLQLETFNVTSRGRESPLFMQQDDDLAFLRSRPLSRITSRHTSVVPGAADSRREGSEVIDLTDDQDDDLYMVDSRTIPAVNRDDPTTTGAVGVLDGGDLTALGYPLSWLSRRVRDTNQRLRDRISGYYGRQAAHHNTHTTQHHDIISQVSRHGQFFDPVRSTTRRPNTTNNTITPSIFGNLDGLFPPGGLVDSLMMDYSTPGFNLGLGSTREPAPEQYVAPLPVADGFTRGPVDNEEVVCPNCGKELAVGEAQLQQQVWVVKKCGHAYCGTCVQPRLVTKKGPKDKGKQRADVPAMPARCVVQGCNQPVGKKTLVHVFLSS